MLKALVGDVGTITSRAGLLARTLSNVVTLAGDGLLPGPADQIAVAGYIVNQKNGTISVSICVLTKVRTESVSSATLSAVFIGPPGTGTTEHS